MLFYLPSFIVYIFFKFLVLCNKMFSEEKLSQTGQKNKVYIGISFLLTHLPALNFKKTGKINYLVKCS